MIFFAVLAPIGIYKFLFEKKRKIEWLILTIVSLSFIVMSQSRSAVLSMGLPVVMLFAKNDKYFAKYKKHFYLLTCILLGMLFYFAREKSILQSRAYFAEGVIGFLRNPLGVGMGNFSEISLDSRNHFLGLDTYSMVAHNLPIEFLT